MFVIYYAAMISHRGLIRIFASTFFNYDLPTLSPGNYTAQWMLLGEDGHKMDGSFDFMVHGSKSMQDDKKAHSQHKDH